jgi:uncharacterized protein (UPF0218 family)
MRYGFAEHLTLYRVDDRTKMRLKHPLGQLIVGSPDETIPQLVDIINRYDPRKIIAVGDVVSLALRQRGVNAAIYVIDHKTERKSINESIVGLREVTLRNPPGVITREAIRVLQQVLDQDEPTVVLVDGEEDLLVLPLVLYSPIGSIVVYGQPLVGMVAVIVSLDSKNIISGLLKAMEISESEKG